MRSARMVEKTPSGRTASASVIMQTHWPCWIDSDGCLDERPPRWRSANRTNSRCSCDNYCRHNCPAGLIQLDVGPRRSKDLRIANRTDSKCNCDIADTIASLDRSCWMIGLLCRRRAAARGRAPGRECSDWCHGPARPSCSAHGTPRAAAFEFRMTEQSASARRSRPACAELPQ